MSKFRGICSKRKQLLEDLNLLKKLKINETSPGTSTVVIDSGFYCISEIVYVRKKFHFSDIQARSNDPCNDISNPKPKFRCSYSSGGIKRMREDEAVEVVPCKRLDEALYMLRI